MAFGWGSVISGALSIGGALLSGHEKKKEAKEQEKSYKEEANASYEAALAQQHELYMQAGDLDEMARRQAEAAAVKSYQIQRAGQETASAALSAYAGSGVVAGEGSAGIVPAHIVGTAAEDVFTNVMNANDQIFQIQQQAAANRRQGDVKAQAGLLAKERGTAGAAASANSIINASYANTLMSVGNTASGWFS